MDLILAPDRVLEILIGKAEVFFGCKVDTVRPYKRRSFMGR